MDPKIVGVVVAIGFIILVGVIVLDGMDIASSVNNDESFTVTDPGVDKVCGLSYDPVESSLVVRYYNGTAWSTLASSEYTLSGSTLTVKSSAMD